MNDGTPVSVFLGVPAVLTPRQQPYLEKWLEWMEHQALEVVRLKRDAYGQDPRRTLMEVLPQTDGVVLLGFRQLDARAATWRPHTKEEVRAADWWTTPWLHFEAGISVGLGLPMLVAPEEGVYEGVFSPDVWDSQVHGTILSSPGEAGEKWLELVHKHCILRKERQGPPSNEHDPFRAAARPEAAR